MTVIVLLVLGLVVVLFALMAAAVFARGVISVQLDLRLSAPPVQVAHELDRRLPIADLRGAQVRLRAPGQPQVVIRETPGWTIIPTVLLFPVGALALLIKEDVVLEVFSFPDPRGSGTIVRLTGRTRKHVLKALVQALTDIAAGRTTVPR